MDPQEAYMKFIEQSGIDPGRSALAFFVGYAYGATGARENIDALIEALHKSQTET